MSEPNKTTTINISGPDYWFLDNSSGVYYSDGGYYTHNEVNHAYATLRSKTKIPTIPGFEYIRGEGPSDSYLINLNTGEIYKNIAACWDLSPFLDDEQFCLYDSQNYECDLNQCVLPTSYTASGGWLGLKNYIIQRMYVESMFYFTTQITDLPGFPMHVEALCSSLELTIDIGLSGRYYSVSYAKIFAEVIPAASPAFWRRLSHCREVFDAAP